MSGIDQLLLLVKSQGSTELRLAVDQEPQMFANGQRKRLTMAITSEFALRHLVAPLLTSERDTQLREQGHLTFDYPVQDVGQFRVTFTERGPATLKVLFQLSPSNSSAPSRRAREPLDNAPVLPSVPTASNQDPLSEKPSFHDFDGRTAAHEEGLACSSVLRELIQKAFQRRASDIHLADNEPAFLRIDGRLSLVSVEPHQTITELFTLTESLREKLLAGNSADFGLDVGPGQRLRISLYRSSHGLCAAIRLLPQEAPALSALNLPMPLNDLVELSHGLVLVCGATGSGKSTTLAALAKHALEVRSIVLVTLEEPIEFNLTPPSHSVVRRRQVGRDVASFRSGLRDALRGDPDVILVGELRDPDTIQLALTAAETGHLVLASLHSGGAASTLERIVDAYPADRRSQIRVQLADALRAVIAQQLVPRAQGTGRVPVMELLRVTHAASNIIREGRTAQIGTLLQSGKREGMLSMDRCLADYVHNGVISREQAQAAAHSTESLAMYLTQ